MLEYEHIYHKCLTAQILYTIASLQRFILTKLLGEKKQKYAINNTEIWISVKNLF